MVMGGRSMFNSLPWIYWSEENQMSFLQRCILIYSVMYYEQDVSCVSDKYYDELSKKLYRMQKDYPEQFKLTDYYYAMYDFDGTTGFDLPDRLNDKDRNTILRLIEVIKSADTCVKVKR